MTTIIPIPAFRDNYIWALRNGRRRGGRRSRRRGAGARVARRERRSSCPRSSPRIIMRDHVGGVAALCDALRRARVRARARGDSAAHARACAKATAIDVPGVGARARRARHSGPHGGPHRVLHGRATTRCCSAATRCSPRDAAGCSRARPSRCGRRCRSSRRCRRRRACTAGTSTRSRTCASREAVEPDNADVRARIARERAKRERDVPTLPSTIGDELATNPFLRAAIARRDGERVPRMRGRPMDDVVDSFATLRQLEERFPVTRRHGRLG